MTDMSFREEVWYPPEMRGCVRVGCSDAAVAGLALDPEHQRVWIVDLPADAPRYIGVCHAHADLLTVPEGWSIVEDRNPQGRLFVRASPRRVRSAEERRRDAVASITHLEHRRRDVDVTELQLFDDTPAEVAAAPAEDDARTNTWVGDPDLRRSEHHDVDDASPLLQRAFRASRAS